MDFYFGTEYTITLQVKKYGQTMKRFILILMLAVVSFPLFSKEDWRGKVVDENGEPVPYANVAVLSCQRSRAFKGRFYRSMRRGNSGGRHLQYSDQ